MEEVVCHQELIDELLRFAREHNLRLDYCFDDKNKLYRFVFQNQAQTWGFCREYSKELLDLFNGPTVYFAYDIIDTLRRKVPLC